MQNIKILSNDRVNLGAGTLYGAINTLLEKNWIKSVGREKDSRKKEYQITELGMTIIKGEITRLEELITNGKRIVGGGTRTTATRIHYHLSNVCTWYCYNPQFSSGGNWSN